MTDHTGAERQRRYMARLKAKAAAASVSDATAALKQELAEAKARIRELVSQVQRLRDAEKRTERPPDEVRDQRIKGLQTRVRNLTAELRVTREMLYAKSVLMFDNERSAIIKALHPDRVPSTEQRTKAIQAFNAWWDRQPKRKGQ
jgi:predicted  nucleic acid-binding Zn-ribbon protein